MIGIYAIKCLQEPYRYVGSSIQVNIRWAQHIRELDKGTHHNIDLQLAWDAYGSDSFVFKLLEKTGKCSLTACEQKWIDFYGFNNCYNISHKANNPLINKAILGKSLTTKSKNGHCLSAELVKQIKELIRDTELKDSEIASIYNCNYDIINNIRRGKTWSSVTVSGFTPSASQLTSEEVISIKKLFRDSNLSNKEIADIYKVSHSNISAIRTGRSWKSVGLSIKYDRSANKLTKTEVKEIKKEMISSNLSNKELADKYKVHPKTISDIRNNKSWVNIEVEGFDNRNLNKSHIKLTKKDVVNIKQLFGKKSIKDIAKQYNVSYTTIHNIRSGRSWANVDTNHATAIGGLKTFETEFNG